MKWIDLEIAWQGFSPIHWVYQYSDSALFPKDFKGGVEGFGKSAFMYLYSFGHAYLGIKPETLLPIILAIEIAVLSWAVYVLSRTIFPDSPPIVPVLIIVLVIASYARYMNLALIGQPGFLGKYNNIADALRIFAVVMILKKRYMFSSILLAAAFVVHPNMGLTGGVFLAGMLIMTPREFFQRKLIIGVALFCAVACLWVFFMFDFQNFAGSLIPKDMWFKLTMLHSYHWYPVEFGVFTFRFQAVFFKFLSFLILLVFYISRISPLREIDRKLIAGMFVMMVLVIGGVVFSILKTNPTLIKLHLHRANDLVILVGLVYIVRGLWDEVASGTVWRKIIAAMVLISPFNYIPGAYPLVFSFMLTAPAWLPALRGKFSKTADTCVFITFAGIVSIIVIFIVSDIRGNQYILSYTATGVSLDYSTFTEYFKNYLNTVNGIPLLKSYHYAIILLFVLIPLVMKLSGVNAVRLLVCGIFTLMGILWLNNFHSDAEHLGMCRSYKQVQLWAKENTKKNALFMVDPTIYYGWRDYSQRSSFGNLREWTFNWAYSEDINTYKEGMRRFGEFSIDLDKYIYPEPNIDQFAKLSREIQNRYYSFSDKWRMNLCKFYGINYFVLIKDKIVGDTVLPVVYENENFVVLSETINEGWNKPVFN